MTRSQSGFLGRMSTLQRKVASAAEPFVFLALRILFGYAIFRAGYSKLMNPDMFAARFEQLGIPAATLNVYIAGFCEAAGGLLLMAGLATRMAASVLVVVMVVATVTAHRAEMAELFSNPFVVATAAPIPFLAMFLVFAIVGPGRLSVDQKLSRK
jgi:putative oxidoreductase